MKGERVAQLELILRSHPEGIRKAEIARRIGVHRSTIGRYIDELKLYSDVYEDNNLIKIIPRDQDEQIALSVYESLALNMGAELLMKNSQYQNPHIVSALRKIAVSMNSYAPKIANNIMSIADETEKKLKHGGDNYGSVLEVLIDSWVSGRMVKIVHYVDKTEEETELAPYFIGFVENDNGRNPITVTGRLRHTTEIITLDIAKIKNVKLLNETYTIPDNLKVFNKTSSSGNVQNVIDTISLQLKIRQKSALNSFRSLAHSEFKVEKINDEEYLCNFEAENSIELILRLIQCMDSVEVIGPVKFRNKFVGILRQILAIYE